VTIDAEAAKVNDANIKDIVLMARGHDEPWTTFYHGTVQTPKKIIDTKKMGTIRIWCPVKWGSFTLTLIIYQRIGLLANKFCF
jgi:hypothetical protein